MTTIGIVLAAAFLLTILILVYQDMRRTMRRYHRRMPLLKMRLARVREDCYWDWYRESEYELACGLYLDARSRDRRHLEAIR